MKRRSFPLDLSALAYPMMQSKRAQSNYRFSARFASAVDPALLERSLAEVLPDYPNLQSKIVPSFFWHKFVTNDAPLIVKEDARTPLAPLRREDTNGYPFRLAYLGDEIILEIFHAATDGDVAALFLSDLLTRYIELKNDLPHTPTNRALVWEDPFIANAKKKKLREVSLGNYNGKSALALGKRGNYLPSPTLRSCAIEVDALKAAAKAAGATITEYISACYIAAILQKEPLPLKKPLCLFLPINLRRFFPSETLLNFICFERVTLEKGSSDLSFEKILSLVHEQFAKKITRENMQKRVDDVCLCFNLPFVKYLPLFIKKPCFKLVKALTNKVRQTAILSNVGSVTLSPEIAKEVLDVRLYLNIGKNAPMNVAIISYNGVCRINMTCGLKESDLPDRFFALLRAQGRK